MNYHLTSILKNNLVLKYILKHEDLIHELFDVPSESTPMSYVIALANQAKEESATSYSLSPIYCTTTTVCSFCSVKLVLKKALNTLLYDEGLGTRKISVLCKYCKSCKLTYYPGFSESYQTQTRIFEDDWEKYDIFVS